MEILNVVSIIIAGLMVGTELAIAAFVHPSLERLPDDVHLPVANGLAREPIQPITGLGGDIGHFVGR